ncbi:hypothetical protein T08_7917 [Trichinella sp. T8]|nr:hypothetical protein T08_7917 [Trichinella sp. T8]
MSSGKLRRSLAISVWFGISQRVRKNWILFMTAIKVATVVDPVGIRAINEVAFFGNYALLNIQLLLFNSYRMYILFLSTVGSSIFKIIEDSEGSFIPESVNPDRNQCPYRWRCVLVEAIAVTVTIENEYFNVLVRACENKSRIRNAPIE